jgi:hypothetical protein
MAVRLPALAKNAKGPAASARAKAAGPQKTVRGPRSANGRQLLADRLQQAGELVLVQPVRGGEGHAGQVGLRKATLISMGLPSAVVFPPLATGCPSCRRSRQFQGLQGAQHGHVDLGHVAGSSANMVPVQTK